MSGVHIPIVLGGPCGGDRNSLQNRGLRILLMMGLVQGTGVPCRVPLTTRCCSSCPSSVVCSVVLCVRWWGQHIKRSLRCWGAVSMVEGHFSEPATHIHRQANGSLETGRSSVPPSKAVQFNGHSTSFHLGSMPGLKTKFFKRILWDQDRLPCQLPSYQAPMRGLLPQFHIQMLEKFQVLILR